MILVRILWGLYGVGFLLLTVAFSNGDGFITSFVLFGLGIAWTILTLTRCSEKTERIGCLVSSLIASALLAFMFFWNSPTQEIVREIKKEAREYNIPIEDIAITHSTSNLRSNVFAKYTAKIAVTNFEGRSHDEMVGFLRAIHYWENRKIISETSHNLENVYVVSDGHAYIIKPALEGSSKYFVWCDDSPLDEEAWFQYRYDNASSGSSSSSSSKKKCDRCNGTGMVKYYYGDSATEAFLNGHEDSWYGQCGSCQGTGYR